jgi:hypothetical protein
MSEQTITGPRLSDADFFAAIDPTFPGMEALPDLIANKDWQVARKVFADAARAALEPERFFTVDYRLNGNTYMKPDETYEEAVERVLNLELISCGVPMQFEDEVDWKANPTFNQYREWTWQLSRHWDWKLLAHFYRKSGDARYAEAFVKMFRSWVQQAVVPQDAPGGATKTWRTIEAGIRQGQTWPVTIHAFINAPALTDDDVVNWFKSTWEHGWRLRNFHRTHNWLIMEMNGLAQIGILYPFFKKSQEWKVYALDVLDEQLAVQVHPDGFQFELTTGYHQVNIRNYIKLMDVAKAYDQPVPPSFYEVMEKMFAANVKIVMPDFRLPDVNDGTWGKVGPMMEDGARYFPEREDFAWAHTHGEEGSPPDYESIAFDYAGYYIMRTGWQRDALYALFDGGPFGYAHQHEDKLNLIVYGYGRRLLTEAGKYAYDTSEMRRYVLSTRGHNTIRVDGQDQNRGLDFRAKRATWTPADVIEDVNRPADAKWVTTDTYDAVEALYDEGYGPDADKSVTHRRRVIFLKQPPAPLAPCFVVIDWLTPSGANPHTYDVLWHFNTETAALTADNAFAVVSHDAGEPNLAVIAAEVPGLNMHLIIGKEDPWQGWKSTGGVQGEYAPAPTADFELSSAGPVRLVTLVYPIAAGEKCPVVKVEAGAEPHEKTMRFVLHDGAVVEINEGDYVPA